MAEDYYSVLGVSKSASADELKKAYRQIAKKYHPDRNQGDAAAEAKFKEATEAYEVLSDSQKRSQYDRFGHSAFKQAGGGAGAGGGFSDIFEAAFQGGMGDVFESFFGGGGSRKRSSAQRGADLQYHTEVEFEEAVFGASVEVQIPRLSSCEDCRGHGAKSQSDIEVCQNCGGAGQVRVQQGFFSVTTDCSTCRGVGKSIKNPCKKCRGAGRIRENKNLKINIPAGVEDGNRIRMTGEGEAGLRGGPPGDLYVSIQVKPHEIFMREGNQLSCDVPVSFPTLALGGAVEVPTLEGVAEIKVPAGTQSHKIFRLRGKGVTHVQSNVRGDLHARIIAETPTNLTEQQRQLLEQFQESMKESHTPILDKFKDKIKNLFS